ncbi:MAG TPA: alpha/beta hydrolase [Alphaproteobacteria bacterium]|jgi:pimeloyl-ACP methyl ester carboxylesterase|nr:alpha/beta hydrolase [Alphaproteobacteria bacterium]
MIIILHGWTYSLDKWQEFEKNLKKERFSFKFLKIPGLTSETNEVWDIEKYSEWLKKELDKEKGKVVLVGHSNGGRIATYFASDHPEKVAKLILMDSAGIYHKEFLLQIKRFVFGILAKVGKKLTTSKILKEILYKLAGEQDYHKANPNMQKSMINLINFDLTSTFKKIDIPTLIIWGENDKTTPLSDANLIHKLIKNSKLKVIKDAKHSPFYTHPKQVVEILKNDL